MKRTLALMYLCWLLATGPHQLARLRARAAARPRARVAGSRVGTRPERAARRHERAGPSLRAARRR